MDFFTFIIAMTGTIGGMAFLLLVALTFYRLLVGRRDSRSLSEEEGQMIQELWDNLQRMEDRIINLESILTQRESERL